MDLASARARATSPGTSPATGPATSPDAGLDDGIEVLAVDDAETARTAVDQAIGILMAQHRCSADKAVAMLRRHARNTGRAPRDVAVGMVKRLSGAVPSPVATLVLVAEDAAAAAAAAADAADAGETAGAAGAVGGDGSSQRLSA